MKIKKEYEPSRENLERRKEKEYPNTHRERGKDPTIKWVPGGEIVLSSTDGIVISITGLLDGNPLTAS